MLSLKGIKRAKNRNIDMPDKHYLRQATLLLEQQWIKTKQELSEPNLKYAEGFIKYLELNNRKDRTLWRRLIEVRQLLKLINKDAKKATKNDIENVVLQINRLPTATTSKGRTKRTLKMFYKYLYNSPEERKNLGIRKTPSGT